MENRKTKKADLSRRKGMYFNLGLVFAMVFVISAFEWKTYGDILVDDIPDTPYIFEVMVDIPVTRDDIPKPPKPQPKKKVNPVIVEDTSPDPTDFKDVVIPSIEPEIDYSRGIEVPVEKADEPEVFVFVEKMPEFEGGYKAFMKYLSKKIKYPKQARNMGIEGKVFVDFIIDESGEITEVRTIKGIGAGCDEEAERVLNNAPKWSPGKQRGIPVKVKMVLPINFLLD